MRGIFILSLLILGFGFTVNAHEDEKTNRDTTSAVVVYDAEVKFLPSMAYRPSDYTAMIDSLLLLDRVPVSLVNQLSIYRMLAGHASISLNSIVDSLFDTKNVPQSTINAVNLYLTALDDAQNAPHGFAAFVPQTSDRSK